MKIFPGIGMVRVPDRRDRARLALLMTGLLALCACSGGGDTAGAVDDRLAGALEFDGGSQADGPPPAGVDGEAAPQVAGIEAPSRLLLGEEFSLILGTGFARPAEVDAVVVYVGDRPKRHLVVRTGLVRREGEWRTALLGRIRPDGLLKGKLFELHVALRTKDGTVGKYRGWRLVVADAEPREGTPIDEVALTGEEWHATGRPEGSPDPVLPQIEAAAVPGGVATGRPFTVTLRAAKGLEVPDGTSGQNVAAVIVTTRGNEGYKRTVGFSIRPAVRQGGLALVDFEMTVTDERLTGMTLKLLAALECPAGEVGMYYPLSFPVVAPEGPCEPDPCSGWSNRECDPGTGACVCRTGFHDELGICVPDGADGDGDEDRPEIDREPEVDGDPDIDPDPETELPPDGELDSDIDLPRECTTGLVKCDGPFAKICNESGRWETREECTGEGEMCSGGECTCIDGYQEQQPPGPDPTICVPVADGDTEVEPEPDSDGEADSVSAALR